MGISISSAAFRDKDGTCKTIKKEKDDEGMQNNVKGKNFRF